MGINDSVLLFAFSLETYENNKTETRVNSIMLVCEWVNSAKVCNKLIIFCGGRASVWREISNRVVRTVCEFFCSLYSAFIHLLYLKMCFTDIYPIRIHKLLIFQFHCKFECASEWLTEWMNEWMSDFSRVHSYDEHTSMHSKHWPSKAEYSMLLWILCWMNDVHTHAVLYVNSIALKNLISLCSKVTSKER